MIEFGDKSNTKESESKKCDKMEIDFFPKIKRLAILKLINESDIKVEEFFVLSCLFLSMFSCEVFDNSLSITRAKRTKQFRSTTLLEQLT